jgi:hypothetical protein
MTMEVHMVSEKQLLANRENAKRGGVKTEAGKAISSRNAVTHGLLSQHILLDGEEAEILDALRDNLMAEYAPWGVMEVFWVDRIVCCIWKLGRVAEVETGMARDLLEFPHYVERREKMLRYETAIERQLFKASNELERLQAIRLGKNVAL